MLSRPVGGGQTAQRCAVFAALFATACAKAPEQAASSASVPEMFLAGVVSTPHAHEGLDWVSEDGATVIFTRANADFSSSEVLIARQDGDEWTTAPASFSTSGYDAGVSFARDGSAIFTSTRATPDLPQGNWNIWIAAPAGGDMSFAEPQALPSPVNTESADCCAVVGPNGEIYFSSDRSGAWDICVATRDGDAYVVSALPGAVNSEFGEWPSWISVDGTKLWFSSIRKEGLGGDDIFVTTKEGDAWTAPRLLAEPVNSASYEDSARFFGGKFHWSSRRAADGSAGPDSNIFVLDAEKIDG